jgi:para-nitrobenzyl esterase
MAVSMLKLSTSTILFSLLLFTGGSLLASEQRQIDSGKIEGTRSPDGKIGIYKGIPFAAPPVGPLRWKPPQPVAHWGGVRKATEFGSRCMQGRVFSDMIFRDPGPSEDCLYLNVWTSAASASTKLPVMVWIYGGGFVGGSTSEPRQDGERLAHKGVIVVSMNYRLGVFGFLSHPWLTKESPHGASGNYGLMDQAAALAWVHRNIAAFGGDPNQVTIFGESAGSFSVSAQMASPLSKDLIQRAIGESGAFFGSTLPAKPLKHAEAIGQQLTQKLGANSLQDLRAISAAKLLDASSHLDGDSRIGPSVDGYFLPDTPEAIYRGGNQAHIPLLAGWNHDEANSQGFFGKDPVNRATYTSKIRAHFGDKAEDALKLFPAESDQQMKDSAGLLATAGFIGYGTWKWIQLHGKTGQPVYQYEFDQAPPGANRGAYHSAEIEYVFGNLASKALPFTPDDYKLSEYMQSYWTNFAKTGNPNSSGVPEWPQYKEGDRFQVMHLSMPPRALPEQTRAQYTLLDSVKAPR